MPLFNYFGHFVRTWNPFSITPDKNFPKVFAARNQPQIQLRLSLRRSYPRLFAFASNRPNMSAPSGKKRASPGADVEKNPLAVELSDEDARKLQVVQKDIARTELLLGERFSRGKYTDPSKDPLLCRTSRSRSVSTCVREEARNREKYSKVLACSSFEPLYVRIS